jgi:hypothetical protein
MLPSRWKLSSIRVSAMLPSRWKLSSIRVRELLGQNLFVFAAVLIALFMSLRQVPTSLDDWNYLDYFDGNSLRTYWKRVEDSWSHGFMSGMLALFLGEGLFSLFTTLLSTILSPAWCIRLVVFLINFGVLFAARRHVCPWIFMVAWFMPSVGMVVLGYLQLRQGLALMLLLNLRDYPVAAAFASLGVHRTAVYAILHPIFISTWRRAVLATAILLITIFSLLDLILVNADRGDDLLSQNLLVMNINWILDTSFLLILHILLLYDQNIKGSTRWLLTISTIITASSVIGYFAAPILTTRFAYYPFILYAFALSDAMQRDLRGMRAQTIACACGFAAIVAYDFVKFTANSDFFHSFRSLIF